MRKDKKETKKKNLKLITTKIFVFIISAVLFLELFLFQSALDFVIKAFIFILVAYTSFSLVKSVKYEIESRERIEELAKEFALMNEDLHDLNKQKSEFVVASAHHLMSPLTAISGYASMALEGSFGELSEKVKEAIDRIFKSSKRLTVIVDDFTNVSRIESGEMEYNFTYTDLKKIVSDITKEMEPIASSANLKLEYEIDEKEDYKMNMDKGKIRQVISNLLDNAIKYTPNGFVGVSLGKTKDGNVKLRVYDTGIGMSSETIEKIFLKFTRADSARKFYTEGSGLGLYVAYEILKKHNASILAESKGIGHGSTFNVEFNLDLQNEKISKK